MHRSEGATDDEGVPMPFLRRLVKRTCGLVLPTGYNVMKAETEDRQPHSPVDDVQFN